MNKGLFCDDCGSILEVLTARNGRKFGVCNCGFIKEVDSDLIIDEIEKPSEMRGDGVLFENIGDGFPHKCKKCSYGECEVIDLGASYGDEANVYLFK